MWPPFLLHHIREYFMFKNINTLPPHYLSLFKDQLVTAVATVCGSLLLFSTLSYFWSEAPASALVTPAFTLFYILMLALCLAEGMLITLMPTRSKQGDGALLTSLSRRMAALAAFGFILSLILLLMASGTMLSNHSEGISESATSLFESQVALLLMTLSAAFFTYLLAEKTLHTAKTQDAIEAAT